MPKASPQGLEIIDRARQHKGWTKFHTAQWWLDAYTTQTTLSRFWRGASIRPESFASICRAVGIDNWEAIVDRPPMPVVDHLPIPAIISVAQPQTNSEPDELGSYQDLGNVPDLPCQPYGRGTELQKLSQWVVVDKCKLVLLLGMGGIGKTTLVIAAIDELQNHFQFSIWRSLRNAPP